MLHQGPCPKLTGHLLVPSQPTVQSRCSELPGPASGVGSRGYSLGALVCESPLLAPRKGSSTPLSE